MCRRSLLMIGAASLLPGCRRESPKVKAVVEFKLLEAPHATKWQPAGIPDEGPVSVMEGVLSLGAGQPMTGAAFRAWEELRLPDTGYTIEYEAMRLEGEDFFGTVTFPAGDQDTHVSFVLGGWGGTVTGISSIDFSDANENQTRAERRFENHHWYPVRIEVRPGDLRAWVEDRLVVNVSIKGRKLSLRPGFIDHCRPFGFASYGTRAQVRGVIVKPLP